MSRNLIKGAARVARWWLGGQPPVEQTLAIRRASTCLTCPLNQSGTLFDELTGKAAVAVRAAMGLKHEMNLKLPGDAEAGLHVCTACGCELKLKVWQSWGLIMGQMSLEEQKALDDRCWIHKETPLPTGFGDEIKNGYGE